MRKTVRKYKRRVSTQETTCATMTPPKTRRKHRAQHDKPLPKGQVRVLDYRGTSKDVDGVIDYILNLEAKEISQEYIDIATSMNFRDMEDITCINPNSSKQLITHTSALSLFTKWIGELRVKYPRVRILKRIENARLEDVVRISRFFVMLLLIRGEINSEKCIKTKRKSSPCPSPMVSIPGSAKGCSSSCDKPCRKARGSGRVRRRRRAK